MNRAGLKVSEALLLFLHRVHRHHEVRYQLVVKAPGIHASDDHQGCTLLFLQSLDLVYLPINRWASTHDDDIPLVGVPDLMEIWDVAVHIMLDVLIPLSAGELADSPEGGQSPLVFIL